VVVVSRECWNKGDKRRQRSLRNKQTKQVSQALFPPMRAPIAR